MFYVVFVNNIKIKNIRIGMYLIYFILKLCYDKKKRVDYLNLLI